MITAKRLMEASWALTGVLFAKFFPLVGSILLIRIFGPETYGRYSLVVATINLLLTATGAGLVGGLVASVSARQGIESAEARRRKVHAFAAVNFGLLLLVLAGSAAAAFLGLLDDQLAEVLAANWAPMLFLVAVQVQLASQSAMATVSGVLKRLAFTSLAGGILTTVLQLAGGYQWGVAGALWGMVLGCVIQLLLQARYLRTVPAGQGRDPARGRVSATALVVHAWSDFLQYGGYMFGSSTVVSIGMWLLSYSLLRDGTGMHLVAAFGVLNHWRMLMVFMPLALSNYLTSRFAIQTDPSQRIRILAKSLAAAAVPLILLTAGTLLLTAQILNHVYGSTYAGLATELRLTALIALLSGLNSIFGNFLTGSNLFKEGLISNLVWFVALVAVLVLLRSDGFDVVDASVCLLAAYVFHTVYQLSVLVRRHQSTRQPLRPLKT